MVRSDEGGIERKGECHCRHGLNAARGIRKPELAEWQTEQPGAEGGDDGGDRQRQ